MAEAAGCGSFRKGQTPRTHASDENPGRGWDKARQDSQSDPGKRTEREAGHVAGPQRELDGVPARLKTDEQQPREKQGQHWAGGLTKEGDVASKARYRDKTEYHQIAPRRGSASQNSAPVGAPLPLKQSD